MMKPQDQCEIKLSYDDVSKAIEEYLNKNIIGTHISVEYVRTSQSKDYLLVVEFV